MSVIVKDRVDDILAAVRELGARDVKVGLPGNTASRDGGKLNNPTLGYIHEYGAPEAGIPERPFLIPGVESALPTITALMKMGAKDALAGKNTAKQTLRQVGNVAKGAVQKKIIDGPFIPNTPETIRRKKGGDQPLNNTGRMRLAVDFVIEGKD